MKKSITEHKTPINQKQLMEILKLPSNVIRHLKDKNVLKWKKAGRQHHFDEESIKLFQQTFNRDDYLTIGECKKKLDRWKFYSDKIYNNFYYNNLNIYITVIKMIEGTDDIPKEYRLERVQFGVTKYISKHSFARTLNWLRKLNHKVNPVIKIPVHSLTTIKKKSTKRKGMGIMKVITTKPSTTPMVTP